MNTRPHILRRRPGMAMIYLLVILTLIFALASFAIDYGRVQLSKSQLQISTDAAAKWAALGMSGGKSAARTRANAAAADNPVNGVAIRFASSDVVLGSWNDSTHVFTPNGTPSNAVKLSSTAVIPLTLGKMVNKTSVTLRASAVARTESIRGMIGLNGIDFQNKAFIGSYDSSVNTNPTEATANSNAKVSSNGPITGQNNGTLKGDFTYGPSGSVAVNSWTISGTSTKLTSPVPTPKMPTWNPVPNPGGITNGDYINNGGTLNGGSYWFNSLAVNGPLSFNGPTTIYVNGDITIDGSNGSITAYNSRPGNLTIYQIGAGRKFVTKNNTSIKAIIVAPGSDFDGKNGVDFYGLVIFNTISMKNHVDFFFDESAMLEATAALVQ